MDTDIAAGFADGREWALRRATREELARLAAVRFVDPQIAGSHAWQAYRAMTLLGASGSNCAAFWDFVSGVPEPSNGYVFWFTDAAVAVFTEVEDMLWLLPP